MLILGLISAAPLLFGTAPDAPQVREEGADGVDAMKNAKQPTWVAVMNPFVGVAGVLMGGRLRGSEHDEEA